MKILYSIILFIGINQTLFSQGFLGSDVSVCDGQNTVLDAGASYTEYVWNTNATTRTISVNAADAGQYWAERRLVAANTIDDISQTTSSPNTSYTILGQSFKVNTTGYLRKITALQGPNQIAYNNLQFNVYKKAGFSGTTIATTSFNLPSTGPTQQQLLDVTIPGNVLVYKDSIYTFQFNTGGFENLEFQISNTDAYANGDAYYGGGTLPQTYDLYFIIYIQPVTVERDTVQVTNSGVCTGILPSNNNQTSILYPNPVTNHLCFTTEKFNLIELMDLGGQTQATITPTALSVQLPSLPKGIYFVKAVNEEGKIVRSKIMIE